MVHSPLKSCVLFILLLLKKIIKSFLLYSSHSREPDDRVQPCFASLLIHSRERNTFSTLSLSLRWPTIQCPRAGLSRFHSLSLSLDFSFCFRFWCYEFLHCISPIPVERIVTVCWIIVRNGSRIIFFNFNVFVMKIELLIVARIDFIFLFSY